MKKLRDVYRPGHLALSVELFPPKTPAGLVSLYEHVEKLIEYGPDFITCTYGAGGSTRDRTLEIVREVKRRFHIPVASHLTVVGSTIEQLREYLRQARRDNIDFVVALRGDPPKGEQAFRPVAGGLRYANELVSLIRAEFPEFGIAVAGYPEKHQESPSFELDTQYLKAKVDAGSDVILTQLFFDNADFFRFRERCQTLGISAPIVPGILPVTNLKQIQKIASLCGAKIPSTFVDRLAHSDDSQWQLQVGVEFALQQVQELIQQGVPGLHFYVLNQSQAMLSILETLQIRSSRSC
jgi:methylenetetrahydrofolate reductase (NADPH)